MKFSELMDTVISSSRSDWHHIACWGGGSGPSYRNQFTFSGNDEIVGGDAHGNVAIYMPDISITMAFGLTAVEDLKEDWAKRFPGSSASSSIVDLFYNGSLVYRDIFVNVDGGRAKLPLPRLVRDKETSKVTALQVPRREYQFFSLLDQIESLSDFDRYFEQAGFEIVDEPWPDFRR